ncbi:sensor histidine kinase [Salinimicrobium sp. GXAS 041]|uniref:sensor histidine kinase n=1 Tax=Salinimicrobium sp. GXAS 041 TaxID=3400806 RepID=UPI003C739E90
MAASAIKNYIDTKLILLLGGFYALFDVVYIVKFGYMRTYYVQETFEPWYDFLVFNVLIDWFTVVTYMSLIAVSTKRFLYKNYSWVKIICIHTIFSILIGLIIRLIFDFIGIITERISWSEYEISYSLHRFMAVIDLNFLIYFAMVFIIYTYYYVKQVKEAESQRRILETQLVNTRMKMLSSQLQPHFLFNTLNSIAVLADLDASKAKDTIADLSDFLREILYSSETNEITLEKELQTLDYYLNILNIRFSDHLKITRDIDEAILSTKIPALLLQPLIENSIKHGYSYGHTDLEIYISAYREGKYIVLKVENDGEKITEEHAGLLKKGVGLANLNDRLKNLYGNHYSFEVRNRQGVEGVETVIKLPKR